MKDLLHTILLGIAGLAIGFLIPYTISNITHISKFLIWLGKRLSLLILIPTSLIMGVLGIISGLIIKPFIVGYDKSEDVIDNLLDS